MCALCYELAEDDHWSDVRGAAVESPEPAARAQYLRVRLLATVLAPYGLVVSDGGTGRHVVVADRKGAAEVAAGLPAIWQAAQRLSSRRVDVLDPALLDALEHAAERGQQ